jgi:HSP20 family protein
MALFKFKISHFVAQCAKAHHLQCHYHNQLKQNLMYTKRSYGMLPQTMNNLMDDIFFTGFGRSNNESALFQVPVNILETENSYDLHVVAPGLKKEDFKITIDKNLLHVSFEQKEETNESNPGKWLKSEYKMKSFKRSFTLSEKVDTGNITAKYNDGILLISIAKKEVTEPTAQEIAVN